MSLHAVLCGNGLPIGAVIIQREEPEPTGEQRTKWAEEGVR